MPYVENLVERRENFSAFSWKRLGRNRGKPIFEDGDLQGEIEKPRSTIERGDFASLYQNAQFPFLKIG